VKRPPSKPKQFAVVIWDDVQGSSTDVITDENIHLHHRPVVMKTVGWILMDDAEGVSIACEEYWEDGLPNWRGHTFILRALVRSVTPFPLTAPRKPRPRKKASHEEVAARIPDSPAPATQPPG